MDDGTMLATGSMFRGKNLAWFLRHYAPLYARLVAEHGREKVYKVYDYFFAFVSRLKWGQWMVLDRVCPAIGDRQLFYWVMECIYQSDLMSQMRWEWADVGPSGKALGTVAGKPKQELRLVVVPPTPEQQRRWASFLGADCYRYIDWYGRMRRDPDCNPDIRPEWLLLDGKSQWGADADDIDDKSQWGVDADGIDGQHDDGGEATPPPDD